MEAVIVIMITGIIAAAIAVFMVGPVKGYFDTARRAEMTDIADTALRRIMRDVQGALPNSVRVDATGKYLEFVPIKAAGRYRTEKGIVVTDDPLDFTAADTTFDVLGPAITVAANDLIVIFNMGQPGANIYDAYSASSNFQAAAASADNTITMTAAHQFPYMSPGNRFQVVSTPVTYYCDSVGHQLLRYSGYAIASVQPTPPAVAASILATNVACSFSYTSGVQERNGLLTARLAITESSETVDLLGQVNVVNTP